MDDFLHNLRTGKDKRFIGNRKAHDNQNFNRPIDRQSLADRRKRKNVKYDQTEAARSVNSKQIFEIKQILSQIADSQKRLIEFQERVADAEIRKVQALESIAEQFKAFVTSRVNQTPAPPVAQAAEDTDSLPALDTHGDKNGSNSSKAEIIAMITALRSEGYSYEKIAGSLEAQAIPTLSGRGKWRAATVQRVFKMAGQV